MIWETNILTLIYIKINIIFTIIFTLDTFKTGWIWLVNKFILWYHFYRIFFIEYYDSFKSIINLVIIFIHFFHVKNKKKLYYHRLPTGKQITKWKIRGKYLSPNYNDEDALNYIAYIKSIEFKSSQ